MNQNDKIDNLSSQIFLINGKLNASTVDWGDTYNYFAIGNSITIHSINDYWWNECGAASTLENDYVHQLSSMIENNINQNVSVYAYNFSVWEMVSTDRGECLSLLDGYLSDKLDLITVQLGENAKDTIAFESDFNELISYVQNAAPNAKIVVIGEFWNKEKKDRMKSKTCDDCGVTFIWTK